MFNDQKALLVFYHVSGAPGGEGGTHDIFARVCHFMVSLSTLSGIFDEKLGPFSEVVLNGGLQNTILRAVLGKNGFYVPKIFLKLWIFSPN